MGCTFVAFFLLIKATPEKPCGSSVWNSYGIVQHPSMYDILIRWDWRAACTDQGFSRPPGETLPGKECSNLICTTASLSRQWITHRKKGGHVGVL
jgi:hypothetical protein